MERRDRRGTAVPTSEMKISKSAERGEGRGERGDFGVAVPCVTCATFQVLCQPHQFLLFVREVRWKETLHLEFLLQDF